jgi:hypothetical protein
MHKWICKKNLKRDILSKYKHLKNLKPLIVTFLYMQYNLFTIFPLSGPSGELGFVFIDFNEHLTE